MRVIGIAAAPCWAYYVRYPIMSHVSYSYTHASVEVRARYTLTILPAQLELEMRVEIPAYGCALWAIIYNTCGGENDAHKLIYSLGQ